MWIFPKFTDLLWKTSEGIYSESHQEPNIALMLWKGMMALKHGLKDLYIEVEK